MQHKHSSSRKVMFVIEEYMAAHGITDMAQVDWDHFAEWAHKTGKYRVTPPDPIQLIRRQASRALRDSLEIDRQERLIRRYHHVVLEHPVTHEKIDRWVDITTAPPDQMKLAFAIRKEAAFADVHQLSTDLASYNDNNKFGATLQMSFNFDLELEERSLPPNYPTQPPDDDNDDSDED
jgi:hypothetical protein